MRQMKVNDDMNIIMNDVICVAVSGIKHHTKIESWSCRVFMITFQWL